MSEVQGEGNVIVYCDVFLWYRVREMLLCTVMCVRSRVGEMLLCVVMCVKYRVSECHCVQ